MMCNYWVNFIKTGDPNGNDADGKPMPYWYPYEKEKPKTDTQKCWISQCFQWKVIKEKGDGKGNGKQQKQQNVFKLLL